LTLIAKKELPAKLVAYFPFDEGKGDTAKDAISGVAGKLLRATWVGWLHGSPQSALHFGNTRLTPYLLAQIQCLTCE
jgi:hypothetical protein